jgi:hypothetical protein
VRTTAPGILVSVPFPGQGPHGAALSEKLPRRFLFKFLQVLPVRLGDLDLMKASRLPNDLPLQYCAVTVPPGPLLLGPLRVLLSVTVVWATGRPGGEFIVLAAAAGPRPATVTAAWLVTGRPPEAARGHCPRDSPGPCQ